MQQCSPECAAHSNLFFRRPVCCRYVAVLTRVSSRTNINTALREARRLARKLWCCTSLSRVMRPVIDTIERHVMRNLRESALVYVSQHITVKPLADLIFQYLSERYTVACITLFYEQAVPTDTVLVCFETDTVGKLIRAVEQLVRVKPGQYVALTASRDCGVIPETALQDPVRGYPGVEWDEDERGGTCFVHVLKCRNVPRQVFPSELGLNGFVAEGVST